MLQSEHELAQLKRLIYGVKSERFEGLRSPGQMPLFEGEAAIEEPVNIVAPPRPLPLPGARRESRSVRSYPRT
ncbi:MAG: transposase [Chloroflexi bacterium]|nr:transposase [Chloroflexota bacterium]